MAVGRIFNIDTANTNGEDLADILEMFSLAVVTGQLTTGNQPAWAARGFQDILDESGLLKFRVSDGTNARLMFVVNPTTGMPYFAASSDGRTRVAHHPTKSHTVEVVSDNSTRMTLNKTGISLSSTDPAVTADFSAGSDALRLPGGTEDERPDAPQQFDIRGNEDEDYVEWYDGSEWKEVGSGGLNAEEVRDEVAALLGTGGDRITISYTDSGSGRGSLVISNDIDDTDNLPEGSNNQYWTTLRFDGRLNTHILVGTGLKKTRDGNGKLTLTPDGKNISAGTGIQKVENANGTITLNATGSNLTTDGAIDGRLRTLIDGGDGIRYDPTDASATLTKIGIDYDEGSSGANAFYKKVMNVVGGTSGLTSGLSGGGGITVNYSTATHQISVTASIGRAQLNTPAAGSVGQVLSRVAGGSEIAWRAVGDVAVGVGDISTDKIADLGVTTAKIANSAVKAAKLDAGGNGTNNQLLASNGAGGMKWVTSASTPTGTLPSSTDTTSTVSPKTITEFVDGAAVTMRAVYNSPQNVRIVGNASAKLSEDSSVDSRLRATGGTAFPFDRVTGGNLGAGTQTNLGIRVKAGESWRVRIDAIGTMNMGFLAPFVVDATPTIAELVSSLRDANVNGRRSWIYAGCEVAIQWRTKLASAASYSAWQDGDENSKRILGSTVYRGRLLGQNSGDGFGAYIQCEGAEGAAAVNNLMSLYRTKSVQFNPTPAEVAVDVSFPFFLDFDIAESNALFSQAAAERDFQFRLVLAPMEGATSGSTRRGSIPTIYNWTETLTAIRR